MQQFGPHDGGTPGVTPPDGTLGGGRPPAPANDNTPGGGGKPQTPPGDESSGGGKPPTPANDNTPGGDEPPTPANDNAPGKASDTADTGKGDETTEQTGKSDGGAPGEASPEQAEDGSAGKGDKEAAVGEADPTVQTKDSPGGEENGEGEKTATDSQSKEGQKYPKPTAETNAAAKLVRDTMNADPRFQGLHPAVGVSGYADGTFDVGLSGRAKAVSESADILQDQLPDNFRVLKTQPNRADFPGFRDVGTNMNKQGALSCAEPKLVQGAREYQSGDGSGRDVQGMSVIWRGMEPDGTPLPNNHAMPLEERGPGGEDLDLMKPCTRCQANEPVYMDGVQVSPPSSGP